MNDMNKDFEIRVATPADAEGILRAHYSAVHETAKRDYSEAVLAVWSRPVDAQRIAAHRTKMETDTRVISFVAVESTTAILGFAELWPPETLGAVYIAAPAGRRGVASALVGMVESKAREIGTRLLRMDSSLTAAPFYRKHGFREISRRAHVLAGGLEMPCIQMEKVL
jgi:putative acetyltransferase